MDAEVGGGSQFHEPVLLKEIVDVLRPERGGVFIDCTLGLGGHAEAILKASPDARLIGIDRDGEALASARKRLAIFDKRFQAVHANFTEISQIIGQLETMNVQGVLADLGVSSLQLDDRERGFSFAADAPLDMRMDRSSGETAADLVSHLTERELADLIFEYGEERGARRIARAIERARASAPLTTTKQLADLVVRALHISGRWRIHPATRTFQALRIAVNQELRAVEAFIPNAITALAEGGRLAIISFHSLEDRIVKRSFLRESGRCDCPVEVRRLTQSARGSRRTALNRAAKETAALVHPAKSSVRCAARDDGFTSSHASPFVRATQKSRAIPALAVRGCASARSFRFVSPDSLAPKPNGYAAGRFSWRIPASWPVLKRTTRTRYARINL